MVLVDYHTGSIELLDALSKKVPCMKEDLQEGGDFVFEGSVECGRGLVAIERKTVSDALDCMITGRLSGEQLIKLTENYKMIYLIVEGMYRPHKDTGLMEYYSRRERDWVPCRKGTRTFMYDDFQSWLMTMTNLTPLKLHRTVTDTETVQMVASMFKWHNNKAWNEHTAHLQMHNRPAPGQRGSFVRPPLRREIACRLPGVGWERSKAIMDFFPTSIEMINADVSVWTKIEGIGKGIASQIWNKLRSE